MKILKTSLSLVFLLTTFFQLFSQGIKREILWSDYPFPIEAVHKAKVRFGHIVVPETRNSENPRTLKIAFCHIKGESENGLDYPVIFLPGGPGGSHMKGISSLFQQKHWQDRFDFMDVIVFDPRGCGQSEPDLCPALDNPEVYYSLLLGQTPQEREKITINILKECQDSLNQKGIDINAYGTDEIAEDIEDLRVSLGIKQWNIQGGSYGTRYGQGVMRKFPKTVRTANFTGLVPTIKNYEKDGLKDFSRALQLILSDCAKNPDCAKNYPNLEKKLFDALVYYDKNPLLIPANKQKLIKEQDIYVNGEVILSGLILLSYNPVGIEIIPKFIQALIDKNEWFIENFVNSIGDTFEGNQDMLFYIRANDNPVYKSNSELSEYDDFTKKLKPYFIFPKLKSEQELAELVGIKTDTIQQIPIPSDIPVLLHTGLYDPVTPPDNTTNTSKYLTNSVTLTFPGSSHWSRGNECFSDMITQFYRTTELPKKAEACLDDDVPISYVLDISDNKGIAILGSKVSMGKTNEILIPLGISLLLVIIGFLGLPIYALIRYIRQKRHSELKKEKFQWKYWILSLLIIVFIGLLITAIITSLNRNVFILGFGLLSSWSWVFWIMIPIIALLIYLILRRKSLLTDSSKPSRVLSTLSCYGTLIFIALLVYWQVLWPF